MQKKNTKIWIALIITPFVLLVGSAIMQIIVRLVFGSDGSISDIVSILTFLLGAIGVLLIIGLPAWIILLVLAMQHNQEIEKQTQKPPSVDQ